MSQHATERGPVVEPAAPMAETSAPIKAVDAPPEPAEELFDGDCGDNGRGGGSIVKG